MPELPEVETVARGLQREVAGRRVVSVTLGKTDFMDNPGEIERALPGALIRVVERYGKFMLLRLRGAEAAMDAAEEIGAAGAPGNDWGNDAEGGERGARETYAPCGVAG